MAVIANYTQQPSERLDYDIPYDLETGDSIASATATVTPAGLTVNSLITGSTVKLWVEGGVSGTTYKAEITTTTALGRTKQVEVKFKIREQ